MAGNREKWVKWLGYTLRRPASSGEPLLSAGQVRGVWARIGNRVCPLPDASSDIQSQHDGRQENHDGSVRLIRGRAASSIALVLAIAAGCGGGSETYSLEPSVNCLREAGATDVSTSEDDLDYIAAAAREGAVRGEVSGTEVHVAFERNADDAADTADAYKIFGVDGEKLAQEGNVVIAWSSTPTDKERETVESCLSE